MTAFVKVMEAGKSRAVAAAKFVVTGGAIGVVVTAKRGEGEGRGGTILVVEHEIRDGFAGDFATFGHEICEVAHKLALTNSFPQHVISYTDHIQNSLRNHL